MTTKFTRRKRISAPESLWSHPAICGALNAAAALVGEITAPSADTLAHIAKGNVPELLHPLCEHMPDTTAFPPKLERSAHELILFQYMNANFSFSNGFDEFTRLLKSANKLLPDCDGRFRVREAGLSADGRQLQVLFPKSQGIEDQLAAIHRKVVKGGPTLATAIVALAMLLNCHPFSDGNGRVARVLFAVILARAGATGYFPLHLFAHPCRMSFDLCLREIEVRNDWEPFVRHICAIIAFSAEPRVNREPTLNERVI